MDYQRPINATRIMQRVKHIQILSEAIQKNIDVKPIWYFARSVQDS